MKLSDGTAKGHDFWSRSDKMVEKITTMVAALFESLDAMLDVQSSELVMITCIHE